MCLVLAGPPSPPLSLFLSRGKREGWGISLCGLGNNGPVSGQWSWSLKDARDRLGHKWRTGILYYLLEGDTVHELTVEVLERDNISCSSPSPYLLHCLSCVLLPLLTCCIV